MNLPKIPLLPAFTLLFLVGVVLNITGSPYGSLIWEAILNNRELVITVLVLLVFKLFQKKINMMVNSVNEEARDKYGFIFLFLLGWILFSSRNLPLWEKDIPYFALFGTGLVFMVIPVLFILNHIRGVASEKFEDF